MMSCFTVSAHAVLIDNLDGTVTQNRVDGSSLMWLMDANYAMTSGYDADGLMNWPDANTWIASLNTSNHLGYNDWRLPDTLPVNGVGYDLAWSSDGSTDISYNFTSPNSEMGYMFNVELGNLGFQAPDGSSPQLGWGLANTDPFISLESADYWSGTTNPFSTGHAFYFRFSIGRQTERNKAAEINAWAVRDAESTAVPEPTTVALLGIGLAGMAAYGVRRRRRHGPQVK
jgi:hypothetical protein